MTVVCPKIRHFRKNTPYHSLANGINHTPSDYLISEHGNSETESSKIDEHTNLNPMSSNISLNHQVLPVTNANVLDDAKTSAMSIDGFVGVDRNSVKQFHKQLFSVENSVKSQCGQKCERHIKTSLAARLLKENLESLSSNKSGHSSASEFSEESGGKSRLSNLGQARFSTSSFTRKSLSRNSMARNSLSRNSQSRNSLARDSISKNNNTNQKNNNFPRTSVARNSVNTNKTPSNSVFDQTPGSLRTSLMENITNITPQKLSQNITPQNNVTDDSSKSGVVANIERNSRVRKMSIATRNTIEDIKFLQEKEKWKDSTVVDKDHRVFKKKRLRSRLRPVNFVLKTYYNCVGPFQNDVAPEV